MKVVMIAVTSLDGKLTNGLDSNIYKWTSKEDQDFFSQMRMNAEVIVMGSGTYNAIKDSFNLKEKDKLRIVLTSNPQKYSENEIPEVLEFSSESPKELIKNRLKKFDEILLVGGAEIFSSFAKDKLIDEIYLTIEPIIFGEGKSLFAEDDLNIKLNTEEIKQLNDTGTILLKYTVEK